MVIQLFFAGYSSHPHKVGHFISGQRQEGAVLFSTRIQRKFESGCSTVFNFDAKQIGQGQTEFRQIGGESARRWTKMRIFCQG